MAHPLEGMMGMLEGMMSMSGIKDIGNRSLTEVERRAFKAAEDGEVHVLQPLLASGEVSANLANKDKVHLLHAAAMMVRPIPNAA
jgi:hypothetical protein